MTKLEEQKNERAPRARWRWCSLLGACAMSVVTTTARAQTAPAPPAGVPLELRADRDDVSYELFSESDRRTVIHRCVNPCTVNLAPGLYRVRASGDLVRKTERLIIGGPTRVNFEGSSPTLHWGGLAVGAAGSATAIGSLLAAAWVECSPLGCRQESPEEKRDRQATQRTLLYVAGVGAVVGTVGWVLFATTGTSVTVDRGGSPAASGARSFVSLGAVPDRGGLSLQLFGAF